MRGAALPSAGSAAAARVVSWPAWVWAEIVQVPCNAIDISHALTYIHQRGHKSQELGLRRGSRNAGVDEGY